MEEFYNQYNTPIQKGPRIVAIDNESKKIVRLPKKAEFLPREPRYTGGENLNNSLYAFIIHPIGDADSIVNERLGLDHGQQQYKAASSIPIGVPVNAISGILVAKELVKNDMKIKEIIELFPNQYITTPEGELIYEPNRDKEQQNSRLSEQKNIIEVAGKLGECLSEHEPQIDNNSVNYYIAGSLAQMLYANAEKIEYCNIQDGKIKEIDNEVKIPESARKKLLLTGRELGDLDIIRLNQYVWGQNKRDVIHNASLIQGIDTIYRNKKPRGILDIIYCSDSEGDLDNTVTNDRVCKLTTINGKIVYVASPETIIAQKLDKALKCYGTELEEKKDTKDIVTFINGIYQCYDEEELSKRVADAWKENKSGIPASKQNMQEMKKRLVEMKKEIEVSDKIGEKDISLDNIFRIMAKSIINYVRPQKTVDINNDTKKIAEDPKKSMQTISLGMRGQSVKEASSEIKENYNKLVNPARDTEDKSIDESKRIKQKMKLLIQIIQ